MPSPIRVLAFHAHPDDLEFQCAGTLALLREAGCARDHGHDDPRRLRQRRARRRGDRAIRRGEARAAAELIGADYFCLEFRDLAIFNDDESRRRVTEVLRRVRPDLVLTAPPVDYLCDHEMTSLLVRDACFAAPFPNYAPGSGSPPRRSTRIPHLYFVDPIEGIDRDGRPIPAGFHRRRLARLRRSSGRCSPATPASATGCCGSTASTSTSKARPSGAPAGGRRSAWPRPRGSASTSGTLIPQDNLLLSLIGQVDGSGSAARRLSPLTASCSRSAGRSCSAGRGGGRSGRRSRARGGTRWSGSRRGAGRGRSGR